MVLGNIMTSVLSTFTCNQFAINHWFKVSIQ